MGVCARRGRRGGERDEGMNIEGGTYPNLQTKAPRMPSHEDSGMQRVQMRWLAGRRRASSRVESVMHAVGELHGYRCVCVQHQLIVIGERSGQAQSIHAEKKRFWRRTKPERCAREKNWARPMGY